MGIVEQNWPNVFSTRRSVNQVRYGSVRRSSASPRPTCYGTPSSYILRYSFVFLIHFVSHFELLIGNLSIRPQLILLAFLPGIGRFEYNQAFSYERF